MIQLYLSLCSSAEEKRKIEYVYEKYYNIMFAAAYKVTCNRETAADVVHDTMLKLIKSSSKLQIDNEKSVKTYVTVATKNMAIDFLRSQSGKQTVDMESVFDASTIDEKQESALDVVINNEGYKNLVRCKYSLPDTYKNILYLKYLCEVDEKEISKMLNISYENVATRLYRAKKLLKKKMEVHNK